MAPPSLRSGAARLVVAALLVGAIECFAYARPALTVTYRNSVLLGASAFDQNSQAFTVTGLSGLVFLGTAEYLAVMDNSDKLVRITATIGPDGSLLVASLEAGVSLVKTRDFEGICLVPPVFGPPAVLLADENAPGVSRWDAVTGFLMNTLAVPAVYSSRRANYGFESLTSGIGPSGYPEVWTANEEALSVDGPLSTQAAGTTIRLLRYINGTPVQQYAYVTDPWHGSAITGARCGVADLVLLPDGRLLALERSFAFNLPGLFRTRIYEISIAGATEVSSVSALAGAMFTPVGKTLLWSGYLQNVEGLCLGPQVSIGSYALVGIVDDADPISVNALHAWQLTGVGTPPCSADLNNDRARDTADLTLLLARFGQTVPAGSTGDLNFDGVVNTADLTHLLSAFGQPCP